MFRDSEQTINLNSNIKEVSLSKDCESYKLDIVEAEDVSVKAVEITQTEQNLINDNISEVQEQ